MKLLSVVFLIVAVFAVVYAEEKYSSKYDNIDIDGILANDRLFNNYVACVEGTGKCTADGEELKKHSKEALDNCCEKCTLKQKQNFSKIYKHLETNKPETLKTLKQKFDPTGEHEAKCKSVFDAIA